MAATKKAARSAKKAGAKKQVASKDATLTPQRVMPAAKGAGNMATTAPSAPPRTRSKKAR